MKVDALLKVIVDKEYELFAKRERESERAVARGRNAIRLSLSIMVKQR